MDYTLILIAVAIAALIFFQVRSSKKRQKEAAERLASLVPGVEVMTNFGLYGTLVSMDEEENLAEVEIAPGTVVKLHRQVILRAVEPPVEETEEPAEDTGTAVEEGEPEFGERSTEVTDGSKDTKKKNK